MTINSSPVLMGESARAFVEEVERNAMNPLRVCHNNGNQKLLNSLGNPEISFFRRRTINNEDKICP